MTDDLRAEQLERDLRAMLAARAGDIRTVPTDLLTADDAGAGAPSPEGDAEVIDLGVRLDDVLAAARRRWPLLIAAAVVLAAVAGVLGVLVAGPSHHGVAPAHDHTTQVTRPSCTAHRPASWREPITAGRIDPPSLDGASVAAVTDAGGAVVDQPVTTGHQSDRLGYVAPGARSVHWLGTFTSSSEKGAGIHTFGLDVDVTGTTAVVTVESGGRSPTARRIVTLDLLSGRRTLLATSSQLTGQIDGQAYALDGIVYWEISVRASEHKLVHGIESNSVDGSAPQGLSNGGVYDLEKSALGVEWNLDNGPVDRPADVPAVVSRHAAIDSLTGTVFDSYVTDGQVYAWQTLQGDLDWYDPATRELVRIPKLLGVPAVSPGQASLYGVAGPLVYYQDRAGTGDRVIDIRTGAVVPVPMSGDRLVGNRGTFVGDAGALGTFGSSDDGLLRVDTADLPAARC